MQRSQRLDQRLHMLREEVRTMTQEKERGERAWRERLQRCQRQLKAKEEEMSRQSQYFENFKSQLQHKLSLARDREQSLQTSNYTLEKRLLDMTVSAATGMATISAVRITAGTVTLQEEQERLTSMRGEGEGEEERKEERMKKWQPSVSPEREGGREGDEGQTEMEIEGGGNDTKQSSDESRLQGFILSLQEDLRVLLERAEDGMTERRELMEQLSEAQENGHFLGNRLEEMKAEVHRLKLSESSLMEEVEELREDNDRLQLILREAANQTASQSSSVVENACTNPGTNSEGSSAEVKLSLTAVPPDHHQDAAEITQNKPDSGSKPNLSFQSLSLTSETIDEFNPETWSRRGILDLEQIPSEESDALREAYKSLGLGEDLEDLREQRDRLDAALQHTQKELEMVARENTQLKIQLREQAEERAAEQGSSREMIGHVQSSPPQDNNIPALAQDDLAQALNQENRALAERIEELMAHIELQEVEIKMKQSQLRERASRLEEVRVGLEQENQEQGCLITELTRKTEDDLNTIMELQQKLDESGKQSNTEERVDNIVERVKPQSTSSTQTDDLISVSATGSQHNSHHDLLQNSQQNTLHVDQVCHLTKTVQSLKTEQEELISKLNSLREQQGEVAQSVQTKTEEKQQLTRTVWGLKEEKDRISQCLAGLRQEREQLTRTICGLKDNRDHFIRSMIGLKEEKEQLTKTLSSLEREKEDHHSSGKEEQAQIKQSLQSLQTEKDQLSRAVLNLKQEKEEITTSLKCLTEQRHQEQSSHALKDDRDKLIKSQSSLRDEKERVEHSITRLRHEEEQITLMTQSLKEERESLRSDSHSQTQTQERNQRQQLVNPNTTDPTEKSENVVGTGDQAAQRCLTNNNRGKSIQEQKDLLRETEALGSKLKRSQEELDKSHIQTKKLQSELCQSEARREEAERRAAEKVMRLTDAADQMEETRRENKSLSALVNELQSKVTGLLRERTDALLLKTQIEEQYNILTAQLKAKTLALDELNSEYITLKRGQGNKNDLDAALMSVRTRYNDIRAKYDALLKKRSQTDLDMAPLKAKLSCLVVKCQERNNFLAEMLKTMHRHGCADSTLKQQVELLLSDAALRDYTAAFTPRSNATTGDYSAGFLPRFISSFEDCTSGFIRDQNCPAVLSPAIELTKNGLTPEAGGKCRDFRSDGQVSLSTESTTNIQECRREVAPAATGTPKRNTSSPVQEKPSVEAATALKESSITNTAQLSLQGLQSTQLSLSASGPIQATGGPEIFGFHQSDVRGKSSPDLTSSTWSSLSPTHPPSSSTRRRLSSPEKIINLHEQLQRTLMSSYQAPVSRGRGQDPRKRLSFSAPADLNLTCQTNRQQLSFNKPHNNSFPVTAASNQTLLPGITVKPAAAAAADKSTTLFNAVASRAAHVSFSPNIFTHHHFKANTSTTSALSGSSKSTSHTGSMMTVSPEMTDKVSAVPNTLDTCHTTPLTLGTNSFDSHVSICPDTNLKSTASDTTAPGKSTAPKWNISNGAAPAARDGPVFTASWTQSAPRSPETPNRSAGKSAGPGDHTKLARPRPDAPAEVRSVEVIKTVGQSSLMIGWERPSLDELGCSNGTFVYGYRVFIDGDFHKSVMSSACTKCIVENVDLRVPINVSVQTLGSNGLSSNSVHTVFRTDQH